MEYSKGVIKKVAGPLVIAEGMRDANMFDVVRVSDKHLIGEIIEMHEDRAGRACCINGSAYVSRTWTGSYR